MPPPYSYSGSRLFCHSSPSLLKRLELTNPVFWLSGSFLSLFVLLALTNTESLTAMVNAGFGFATKYFGAYWQVLLLLNFLIGLALAFGRTGYVRLGGLAKPDIDTFKWLSIVLCTLLAGGGVFGLLPSQLLTLLQRHLCMVKLHQNFCNQCIISVVYALGFLAWAILGCLSSIVLMHLHYDKGLPLKPRTLLYPIFGDKAIHGWIGNLADACSIIAVAAGTIGPIGFLGLQISYALNSLFGFPDNFITQSMVIVAAIVMYTLSALSGVSKGIQLVSRYNIILSVLLIGYILFFGPTSFIIDGYVQGVGRMVDNFFPMALYRGDTGWLSWWTVFFWGWFIGYGPMMAIFIARISRGRTIRQLILSISIAAPLITCFGSASWAAAV